MSEKKDQKLLKKYLLKNVENGYVPSPEDTRDYTIKNVALEETDEIPETYIKKGMKVLSQGNVGSCVAHACATAMGYGELAGGFETAHDFSRGYIYGNRGPADSQSEGMYIRQALKQLNKCGDVEYIDFPLNAKYPVVKAEIEKNKDALAEKAAQFKIINYFRCYSDEEVKKTLLAQGAVVIGIPVYSSFKAECPLPDADDKRTGGHAMVVVGWDETGWIIQNSWSSGWGKQGFMHLPYDYPIDELWGITVNKNVPQPEQKSVTDRIVAFLAFYIKYLLREIKRFFTKSK